MIFLYFSERLEDIFQKTLYEVSYREAAAGYQGTVKEVLEEVMEIRERLLQRIRNIRKGEISVNKEQNIRQEEMLSEFRSKIMTILLKLVDKDAASIAKLKVISQDLLRLKKSISNEVTRLLMLPQTKNGTKQPQSGDCTECDVMKEISLKIENLIVCANKVENNDVADARDIEEGSGEEDEAEPKCVAPSMFAMDLISVNDLIDTEVKNMYNSLIAAIEVNDRQELFKNLEEYKSLRASVDDIIPKLMSETDDQKLRMIVRRELKRVHSELTRKVKDCQAKCGPEGCVSCAGDVLHEAINKMNDYGEFLNSTDDEEATKEFIQTDLMRFISNNNEEARQILIQKATEGFINNCEEDKFNIYKITK